MKASELEAVADEVSTCRKCRLWEGRTVAVPGEGPIGSRILLLGEAPGRNEDASGRPFVGRAGHLLDRALQQAGLNREDVFITSVVKCRPPENREPKDDEIEACRGYLERQVDIMKPKVILLLGRVAIGSLAGRKGRILRGPIGPYRGALLFATYHPGVALHGRPDWLGLLVKDLERASDLAR
jgi:uracil-DNA glycosylase family 4